MRRIKNAIIIIMSLLLIISSTVVISADSFITMNGISFYTNADGDAVIVDFDDSESSFEIPASLLGAKVVQIAANAFFDDTVLEEVSFEKADGLRVIGSNAFCGCSKLTSVTLPRLDELGFGAFQKCAGLNSVEISEGLTIIPVQAFYQCGKLENVTIPATVTMIDDYAFGDCTSLGQLLIPATVTEISNAAFDNCEQLVILCYTNSAAHLYAEAHGIPYELLDKKKDIADATAVPETDTVGYNGKAHCPSVSVVYENTELHEHSDYTLEYDNNTEVGTAVIHIIGCGDYEGELFIEFAIKNILGDADGDGIVSVLDVACIQRRLAGLPISDPERAALVGNVSQSGNLEITDATYIQRWLAEIQIPYPVNMIMN